MGHEEHHEDHAKKRITLLTSPLVHQQEVHSRDSSVTPHHGASEYDPEATNSQQVNDGRLDSVPQFKHHEEATTIELFYDLFFVANLTTFTSIHEINESHALSSYAGFFCILWFTWCQVGLFDVRYVTDSVIERLAKACQFGVMVGFAVVGPNFDPASQKHTTFRSLSIILAISRFVLAGQYVTIMWHVKNYRKSKTPLTIIAITYFIAGIIYIGIAFTFKKKSNTNSYLSWYVIAVLETCINIAVAAKWKVVSFKGTHLVQRFSLLTLIILGEGIIVICKAISKITKNQYAWSSATIGTITAAVTIIYILYMLYFDWYSHKHFGSIRQQIWAFLHFPFHLALVLFMEGTAQLIIWQKLLEVINIVRNSFDAQLEAFAVAAEDPSANLTLSDLADTIGVTINDFVTAYPPIYSNTYDDFEAVQDGILNVTSEAEGEALLERFVAIVQNSLFTTYGIIAPEDKKATEAADVVDELVKQYDVIFLVFIYFLVTAGLTLLLMNVLYYLSISHTTSGKLSKSQMLRLAATTVVGVLLCLLSLLSLSADTLTSAGYLYATSPWIIPTATFALLLVLVFTHVHRPSHKAKE